MGEHYDFCGYATKNDLLCTDGRTIRKDAFKDCDGVTVPLVWNHRHDDPEMVLGHAVLENRPDGVFMYGKFNDTEKGNACKKILENRDITGLSIYANKLKQNAGNVLHGMIQEVSLVLKGANPGALIDFSLSHSEDSDGEVYAYLVGDEYTQLQHGDVEREENKVTEEAKQEEPQEDNEMAKTEEMAHSEETVEEVFNTLTDKQKDAVYAIIASLSEDEEQELSQSDEEEEEEVIEHADEGDETIEEIFNTLSEKQKTAVYAIIASLTEDEEDEDEDEEEEKETMKHNVFENESRANVLSHADMEEIFKDAKKVGSLKEAVQHHIDSGVLAHSQTGPDDYGVTRANLPQAADPGVNYGVYDPDMLFPEYKSLDVMPQWIKRQTDWVGSFMSAVRRTPFSRVKTMFADITGDDARALGYMKGNYKKEEFFTLIKRTTDPQTIYKKQKMDRDDITDITGFDVVAWIKAEMRIMLEEEIARACLIGDGRLTSSDDKIFADHVRPISSDSDLFSVKVPVAGDNDPQVAAKNLIKAAIRARKDYKGSGNPTLFITEAALCEILLIEDGIGHPMYANEGALMTTLRVSKIVTVPVMENATIPITVSGTTTNKDLLAIIVNPIDYTIGADKGGAISMFDDFDIDYNQQKYLIETRLSGALTRPYSALVLYGE